MGKDTILLTIVFPVVITVFLIFQIFYQGAGTSCQIEVETLFQEKQENMYWSTIDSNVVQFNILISIIQNETKMTFDKATNTSYIPYGSSASLINKIMDVASSSQEEMFKKKSEIIEKQEECRKYLTIADYFTIGALIMGIILFTWGVYLLKKK